MRSEKLDDSKFRTNPFFDVPLCLAEIYLNQNLKEACSNILEETLGTNTTHEKDKKRDVN
jgi:hypothetical protein